MPGRIISDLFVLNIDGMKITSSTDEITSPGVFIDNTLTFKNHIDELCRKVSYKLHAFRLARPFIKSESQGTGECFY